jgi:hypothetical protein
MELAGRHAECSQDRSQVGFHEGHEQIDGLVPPSERHQEPSGLTHELQIRVGDLAQRLGGGGKKRRRGAGIGRPQRQSGGQNTEPEGSLGQSRASFLGLPRLHREVECSSEVMGQDVWGPVVVLPFEPVGERAMLRRARGPRDLAVGDLPNQPVPELVRLGVSSRPHEFPIDKLIQGLPRGCGIEPAHGHERLGRDREADHRRIEQHRTQIGREGVKPSRNQRLDRVGHLHLVDPLEPAFGDHGHQRFGEEGVTAGPGNHPVADCRGQRPPRGFFHQRGHLG